MISDESDEVIDELFNLFKNRYQNSLQPMRDSEFVFDYVQLFSICYNSRVKSSRNKKDPERITKTKPFRNKYKWEGIKFPSEKDDWKKFAKNNVTIALHVLYTKKKKYIFCLCLKQQLKS